MSRTRTPSVSLSTTSSCELGFGSSAEAESVSGIFTSNSSDDFDGDRINNHVPPDRLHRSTSGPGLLNLDDKVFQEELTRLASALSALTAEISGPDDHNESKCCRVRESIPQIVRPVNRLAEKYDFLACPEILSTTSTLVQTLKDLRFDTGQKVDYEVVRSNLVQLQAALVEKVSYNLTWDINSTASMDSFVFANGVSDHGYATGPSTADGNASWADSKMLESGTITPSPGMFGEDGQIDDFFMASSRGVDQALDRAKAWGRYSKELVTYVQRRLAMEVRHATEMKKLNEGLKDAIGPENFLPLKCVYIESFKYENELSDNCCEKMKELVEWRFVKPLEQKRLEYEKRRRELKDLWQKEVRSLRELELEVEKATEIERQRESSFKKIRDSNVRLELVRSDRTKIEKGRRSEEQAMRQKETASVTAIELRSQLKQKYSEIRELKAHIIKELRELIYRQDQTTKACTAAYFQALATLWSASPVKYQALSDTARAYLPGAELRRFVDEVALTESAAKIYPKLHRSHSTNELPCRESPGSARSIRSPSERPPSSLGMPADEAASLAVNASKISVASIGTPSIGIAAKFRKKRKNVKRRNTVTINTKPHKFVTVRKAGRCLHCGVFSVLHVEQCHDCLAFCHHACVEKLSAPCTMEPPLDAPCEGVFGVPLKSHLDQVGKTIPPVLFQCIRELDKRGTRIKGLYRVPGVLSQVELVTADFDQRKALNLANVQPNVLASVVKLYLKQLPDILLTAQLYPTFIHIAKSFEKNRALSNAQEQGNAIRNLRNLVRHLPTENFDTLQCLMLHLRRLTDYQEENQMTASNLGIIFGPTLMQNHESSAEFENGNPSIQSMLEMPLQNKVVELLILHAKEIFNDEKYLPNGDSRIADCNEVDASAPPSPGFGQSANRNSSATPDLLKNRPPANMQHSPGSSLSDANSEETVLSDDVTDVHRELINQSRAIQRQFQPSDGSSRENSAAPQEDGPSGRFLKTSSTRTPVRRQKLVILRTNSIHGGPRPKSDVVSHLALGQSLSDGPQRNSLTLDTGSESNLSQGMFVTKVQVGHSETTDF